MKTRSVFDGVLRLMNQLAWGCIGILVAVIVMVVVMLVKNPT